jgi:hypothetical protein
MDYNFAHRLSRLIWLGVAVELGACAAPPTFLLEPLRVLNWVPAAGATCVAVDTPVLVTFSHELDATSVDANAVALWSPKGAEDSTIAYDATTFTVRLTPKAPLAYDTLHTVRLGAGLRGASTEQGALGVDLEASFKTLGQGGCLPDVACFLRSDCESGQICSNIGVCVAECVTDVDCQEARCVAGGCVANQGGG